MPNTCISPLYLSYIVLYAMLRSVCQMVVGIAGIPLKALQYFWYGFYWEECG